VFFAVFNTLVETHFLAPRVADLIKNSWSYKHFLSIKS